MGGVGKTQLATEYAYRHRGEYDVVWWVRAEEGATLAADYARLAGELGLPEKSATEQEVVVEAVKRWLEREQGWLLVFDNATKPDDVSKYLPGGVKGHVLITSRNPSWKAVASKLPVMSFEQSEAVEFLLKITEQEDEEAAKELSEELGGLPLALAQAGAYIEANGVTIRHYLELFQSRREELWADESGPLDYDKRTVSATLSLAIKHIEAESPASVDLLNLCAFLGPDDIQRTLLRDWKEHLPEQLGETVADELKLNRVVEALRHYSLVGVDIDKGSLSVHRLVQAVVRGGLGEEESKVWAEAAVDVVNEAFPYESNDVRTWEECARLLPHALAATAHVEESGIASGRAGRLLNLVGIYLRGRAQYIEAKTVLQRSLPIMSKVHGEEHSEYAAALNNLGMVLQAMGDLVGAKAHLERALAIGEQVFGPHHPTVALRANNLGGVLHDMGDLQGAKEHYERALAIDEQAFGLLHPNVAIRVNNLGSVLHDMGDLQGAKEHFEKALAIDEQALGPHHPNVATLANNLGMVLKELGNLHGAKEHYERALAIDEQALGPHHPNVATDVNNLGLVLKELGDLQAAKEHLERALRVFRQFLPEEHPNVAIAEGNLEVVMDLLAERVAGEEQTGTTQK
jgi:tetratricopeptide (TPR) repeat protein